MGTIQNACPRCGKRGGLAKASFGKDKVPGSFCKKCSLFMPDKQSKTRDISCSSCKKPLGPVACQVDVLVDGKLAHKGEELKQFMCPDCSKDRVKAGKNDIDEVLTRYETKCLGGCGTVVGWVDTPEGTENPPLEVGYCDPCTPRAREVESNDKTLDALVRSVSGS